MRRYKSTERVCQESGAVIVATDVSTDLCSHCALTLFEKWRSRKRAKMKLKWKSLGIVPLHRPRADASQRSPFRGKKKKNMAPSLQIVPLHLRKKDIKVCVCNSCVTAVERHRGWRMELLTGAGTGLVNLLFIPFLHLLFPSLSHFRCASHSKRGSLIRGVCVCVGRLRTCVYVGERQRERDVGK